MARRIGVLKSVLLLAVASVTAGCTGETVDMGEGKLEMPAEPDATLQTLAGSWQGTLVDASTLLTASAPVTLRLAEDGSGTLLIGSTALPAPTDPNIGYPPAAQADALQSSTLYPHLYDGVEYPLQGASFDGTKLRFSVDPWRAFDAFCGLQTSIEDPELPGTYNCVGFPTGVRVDRSTGQKRCLLQPSEVEVDCLKFSLCANPWPGGCACSGAGCSVSALVAMAATFDLTLDAQGSTLAGTEVGWSSAAPVAITFQKQ